MANRAAHLEYTAFRRGSITSSSGGRSSSHKLQMFDGGTQFLNATFTSKPLSLDFYDITKGRLAMTGNPIQPGCSQCEGCEFASRPATRANPG